MNKLEGFLRVVMIVFWGVVFLTGCVGPFIAYYANVNGVVPFVVMLIGGLHLFLLFGRDYTFLNKIWDWTVVGFAIWCVIIMFAGNLRQFFASFLALLAALLIDMGTYALYSWQKEGQNGKKK